MDQSQAPSLTTLGKNGCASAATKTSPSVKSATAGPVANQNLLALELVLTLVQGLVPRQAQALLVQNLKLKQ
jgi:hypothetical protein